VSQPRPTLGLALASLPPEARGVLAVLVAMGMFGLMDGASKFLSPSYSPAQILFLRYLFSVPIALAIVAPLGLKIVARSHRPFFQLCRVVLIVIEMGLVLLAFRAMPLADAHAIFAATPLIVTALSMPVLGERVGPRRWLAVLVGFAGVLLELRPGLAVLNPGAVPCLIATILYAIYQVMTRIVSRVDRAETTFLYQIVLGAALLAPLAPWVWVTPPPIHWPLFLLLAGLGAGGHLLLIKALHAAPAVLIQPFTYSMLIWATLFGWLFFGNVPGVWTLLGAALVIVAGVYAALREHRLRMAA
jgi:drug/metabolite transporter (DMT)-like permease